jgi:hypothetical protein
LICLAHLCLICLALCAATLLLLSFVVRLICATFFASDAHCSGHLEKMWTTRCGLCGFVASV